MPWSCMLGALGPTTSWIIDAGHLVRDAYLVAKLGSRFAHASSRAG